MGEEPSALPSGIPSDEEVRAQLERVLLCDLFASTKQLSKLLRYLVEVTLAGRSDHLDAYAIARDALEKRQSFDPTIDTIVRSTLHRLRQRLDAYYTSTGKNDTVEIRIPVRSYVPQFRLREPLPDQKPVVAGETISRYRIIRKIGEGGMGTVYLAEDLELQRSVALKFLPEDLDRTEELGNRVVQEARAAAAIEHPNVCSVYELGEEHGRQFIVSPYVQGEGLDRRIARGQLPVVGAIEIAQQVAYGLAAAHRKGVIHCDIKPSNVIVNAVDSGSLAATIIDFGIARAWRLSEEASNAPAGTLAYMSPEQLHGLPCDPRADLWSLGVVLYEMVTGRKPFPDGDTLELRQAILEQEPEPLTTAAPFAPIELEWILEKALAKEPRKRYQSAEDLAVDLEALHRKMIAGRTINVSVSARGSWRPRPRTWIVGSLTGLLLLLAALWSPWLSEKAARGPVFRFTLPTEGEVRSPAISPNSSYLAYVERIRPGVPWKLMLHDFRSGERRELSQASNISRPAWSPDGLWIAFWRPGILLSTPVAGGHVTKICSLPDGTYTGAAWSADSRWIYFGVGQPPQLYRVQSTGGKPEALGDNHIELEESPPVFLGGNDEEPILLYASREEGQSILLWHDFASGRKRQVYAGASHPAILGDHLFYCPKTGNSQVSSLTAARITGSPFLMDRQRFPIHPSVAWYTVSKNGTLVYLETTPAEQRIVWRDRAGRKVMDIGNTEEWMDRPHISPDGKWVAFGARVSGELAVWLQSTNRATKRRLTPGGKPERPMGWLKQQGSLVYYETTNSGQIVRTKSWEDNSAAADVYRHPGAIPQDLSSDGRFLLLRSPGDDTLQHVDLQNIRDAANPKSLFQPKGRVRAAVFSPGNEYVAYASDETGVNEVYVQAFPSGRSWLVSEGGGMQVRWNPNGKELFFVQDEALVSVPVRTEPSISFGPPKVLFRNPHLKTIYTQPVYDVSPDGRHFAIVETVKSSSSQIRVVSNITETLEDR